MLVNEYKQAWLDKSMRQYAVNRPLQKSVMQQRRRYGKITGSDAANIVARQKAQASLLKGGHVLMKHAAQSQIKGKLGIGLRVGGRVGLRIIPIVGAAMLAYDLYRAYEFLTE